MNPQSAAEKAVSIIGFGYDLTNDIRLSYCKGGPSGSSLIELDQTLVRELVFPGGIVVPNVPKSIKCDKGERTRFHSDVVSFHQMSEQFNLGLSLSGKIPLGLFNNMFSFRGCWHKDAASTKSLAFDGWFITLYNVELERSHIVLHEHVKQELPSTWDAAALARFIGKHGTHIIVGVKMGGKDVIHIKQQHNSNLQAAEVQKLLKNLADKKFSEDVNGSLMLTPYDLSRKLKAEQSMALGHSEHNTPFAKLIRPTVFHSKENVVSIHVRRGGIDNYQSHDQWLSTIPQSPDVISMSLVPITSLLNGVRGGGFLTHAVNLYLRYKPPIDELHQFLEFQIPRQWAPVYGDLPLCRQFNKHGSPSLQFTFMGPKLHVNTVQVDSGNRPVTGIRLYLEGRKSNHIAIHLQHLSTVPDILQLPPDCILQFPPDCSSKLNEDIPLDRAYYEPLKWSLLSHVCTAPVQYEGTRIDEPASIVTKAWFEVKDAGMRKVLFLKLGFSMVASARIRRSEWEGSTTLTRKSGSITNFLSTRFSTNQTPTGKTEKVELNSAVFPGGPPVPTRAPKMLRFVDVKEMVRGPEEQPGYWVITGAKLCVDGGRISLKVKYSLLSIMLEDEPMLE